MTAAVRAPLLAAAGVSVAIALATMAHPLAGAALGATASSLAALLALASADTGRRLLWSVVAVAASAGAARAFVAPPTPPATLGAPFDALREALAIPLRTLVPEPESAILLGVLLGERAFIPREVRDAFATSGTAHLLAISGFHMTLVAAAAALVCRGRLGPALSAGVTLAAVLLYALLVGPRPSVIRAALMACVVAVALALGRPAAAANGLGAAVAVMLVGDPRALEDVGFLMSVSATAGLIAWQGRLARRLAGLPSPIAQGLATTIAASTPTIPIVAATFGRASLVSPLANLVAVPLLAPTMLLGAATAAVGAVVPGAAVPLGMAAYASAAALRHVVEAFAAVPLASVETPSGPLTGVVIAAVLALVLLVGPRVAATAVGGVRLVATAVTRRAGAGSAQGALADIGRHVAAAVRRPLGEGLLPGGPPAPTARPGRLAPAGLAAAVIVAGALVTSGAVGRSDGLRVRALDVGQGDAFLVESAGRYALIDGGPDPSRLLRALGAALPPWERRIDVLVLTHEHADHGNGLLAVLDRYDVRLAVEPVGMNDVPLVRGWSERIERRGIRRVALAAGSTIRLGGLTFRVLSPGRDRAVDVPSLVLLAEAPEGSVLFMGDATDDAIADLLLLSSSALGAQVYVPPHHGAASAHATALVEAVRPEAALLSVGASNRYGHPDPDTLAALADIPVYRTDRHGTVEIELDGKRLQVRTAKAGVPPHRGGPVPSASPAR